MASSKVPIVSNKGLNETLKAPLEISGTENDINLTMFDSIFQNINNNMILLGKYIYNINKRLDDIGSKVEYLVNIERDNKNSSLNKLDNAVKPDDAVDAVKSVETVDAVDAVDAVDTVKPDETVDAVDAVDAVKPDETVDAVKPVDAVKSVETVDTLKSDETVDAIKPVETVDTLKSVETINADTSSDPNIIDTINELEKLIEPAKKTKRIYTSRKRK